MAAAQQEEDLVVKVTLNDVHRFIVVIGKNSSVLDLKSEISKVSKLLSSTDMGQITSVQSFCNHELPNIYKVGRLLKEGDSIRAYTGDYVSNHAGSGVDENAMTLESSSKHSLKGSETRKANKNKSNSADISKDSPQENRIKKTEDKAVSHDDEQECSSKRNEKEDLDKTINTCKDSGSRKRKTRLKTCDYEPVPSGNTECSDKRRKKSSGCEKEKSSNQVQELENNLNQKDGQNTDKFDEHESTQECNDVHDCEDLRSENEIHSKTLKNRQTKSNSPEVQTARNETWKGRNERSQDERENLDNGMNVDSSREISENRTRNIQERSTFFQMENFVLQSEEENIDSRANDGQDEELRLTDVRSTRKRGFGPQSQRTMKTPHSEHPVEQGKKSRRKERHSRTQSIVESLANENQRNRASESASTSSKPSSIVSELVFKSQAFKVMLESPGCSNKRRVQAIKKSVTKVANWLVNGDGIDDETPLIERNSTEVLDKTPHETDHVAAPLNKNTENNTSAADSDIYCEDNGRIYPIIDVLQDRVLYYDSDSGSSGGGLIKETYLSSCQLVIPKLNATQSTDCSIVMPERHKTTHDVTESPGMDLDENDVRKRTEEVPSCAVLYAADCLDGNEEDCGYGSHGILGSSGSEDLVITPKLKHLMSYTNEPLPSNVNKPLVHDGKDMKDDESCFSTEILDSEKQAHVARRSSAKKAVLPSEDEDVTANETVDEDEDQHTQVEKGQELGEKNWEDDSVSLTLENEPRINEETVHKDEELDKKILDDESASSLLENERIISKTTADNGQELNEQNLEADTNLLLGEEGVISEERVSHREKNSTEQNVKDVKATDGLSTVTKDQTEQETMSHGESIATDSCDESILSQSAVKRTSSNTNISRKDYISKSSMMNSDDGKVSEDTGHSIRDGRKKRENKNGESKGEGFNKNADEQTSEKDSEICTNKKESPREKSIRKHSPTHQNIKIVISEKSTCSPRKETSVKERFASTQTTAVVPERCSNSARKETSVKERFASTQTTAVVPERCSNSARKETSVKERFASTQTTAVVPERCSNSARKETSVKERFASTQTTAVVPERCSNSACKETSVKERFASTQTTAVVPKRCSNSARKETSVKERFASTQTTAVVPERCSNSACKETSVKERFASTQTTAVVPKRCSNSARKETSVKERFASTDPSIPESSVTPPHEVTSHAENLIKDKSTKRQKKSLPKNKNISEETMPGGSQDVAAVAELQARSQSAVKISGDVREQEFVTEETKFEKKVEKKNKKKKYKERNRADVSAEEASKEKERKKTIENIQGCNVDEGNNSSDSCEARPVSVGDNCDEKKKKKEKKHREKPTSHAENVIKDKAAKRQKKSLSKNKDISEETMAGGSQDVAAVAELQAAELQARSPSAVKISGDVREQEFVTEETNFEKKEEKKKKNKKKKYKERNRADVSAEEASKEKERKKTIENIQGCNVDEGNNSSDSCEARPVSVGDNCDEKKKKKEKKHREKRAGYEDDVYEEDTTKKLKKTSQTTHKEESETSIKSVEKFHKPVLTRKITESEKIDNSEPNETTKKSRKRSHKKDSEIPSKPRAQFQDRPALTSLEAKEEQRTTGKTKKETKRKEKNEDNIEKEDRNFEINEETPKKKRKRQECEENSKASQNGSCPDSGMFSSGSETEKNIPVTNVLSWISKKIKTQTTEKRSTKKASRSTLMDLAQDDQELSLQKTPFHSSTPFTSRSSSLSSSSRMFHKTPSGFTNSVPRIQEKANFITPTLASNRRKRKLSNNLPQRRELTHEQKEMLAGGINRLEELLDNDSLWD